MSSRKPGRVPVTVNTQTGHLLGKTNFTYVDETLEVLEQLVEDPALKSLYLTMCFKRHGFFGSDGNLAQNLGPFTLQGQDSSIQGTHAKALKVLQLFVYTAAQTNAQQFIQMIFSTSAGKLVFNAYKDQPQLPEDVARASGHDDLAQYLQDVNKRLSKEKSNDAQPNAIDWLELIEAVNKIQKQSSVFEDERDLESGQSKDDDNQSDYFADAETSCGSFDLEIGWSDSEDGEGTRKWLKGDDVTTSSQQGACVNETQEMGSFGEGIFQGVSGGGTQKRENINDRKQETRTGPSQAKRHNQRSQRRPFRGALLISFLLLTIAVTTVLCLAAGAPNFSGETSFHVASNEGYHLVIARELVFLIKLMTCTLMGVSLVILIVRVIRIGQRDHSVTSLSTFCTKTTSSSSGPFSKDERPKKESDERLTPSVEGTSSEAPTVLGTNFYNQVDQKDDGKNYSITLRGSAAVGVSSWIGKLSKKVAASGREEEEARTAPSQGKTTKPKRTRKWLKGDDVTTSSQQGACVNETQEAGSFGGKIFQGVSGGGTQKRENINDRKQETRTGPSQAKRHNQRSQRRPFRGALLISFLLLTIAVTTVLCLAAGAPNFSGGTPLYVASNEGYQLVITIELVLMTCTLMGVSLVILIVRVIRIGQRDHSVTSLSTFCTKTTSSSSDATGCDRNGSQNGQSCLPVRSYCKRETDECYDVMSPTTCSPVRNNCEEDIHDCYDVKSNESKTSAKPSSRRVVMRRNSKSY